MYAHERSLVKRLEDQPFALIGINSDADKDELKKAMEKEHITWRSFWNGPEGTRGPISTKWNVQGWPTIYVVDAKGTIRFKGWRAEDMDQAIDQLLKEMGIVGKKDEPKEPEKSKLAEDANALNTAHQKTVSDFYKNNEEKLKQAKITEEVEAVLAEYQKALPDFNKNVQEKLKTAKTSEERAKLFEDFPKRDETRDKLWALLEKNPDDKEASLRALEWLVNSYHGMDDKSRKGLARAVDLLIKDHADDPEIAMRLNYLIYAPYSDKAEEWLRAVLAKNPAKEARGIACLKLGQFLQQDAEGIRRLKESPEEAKRVESIVGKEAFTKLTEADPDKIAKEAEAVLEEAAAKYGDVYLFNNPITKKRWTIADVAARALFELRNLTIGKTAMDIVGDDLEGKPLKLSDYRGKVVVLFFWGDGSPAARSLYAEAEALVKRLEGKPFALVGVNSDADKDQVKKIMEEEHITWRSFWNGPEGKNGPITTEWHVGGGPATYVLDAKGTIRFKNIRGEEMDRAVDRLLKEMEKDGK